MNHGQRQGVLLCFGVEVMHYKGGMVPAWRAINLFAVLLVFRFIVHVVSFHDWCACLAFGIFSFFAGDLG